MRAAHQLAYLQQFYRRICSLSSASWGLFLVQEEQVAMDEVGGSHPWMSWASVRFHASKVEREGRSQGERWHVHWQECWRRVLKR